MSLAARLWRCLEFMQNIDLSQEIKHRIGMTGNVAKAADNNASGGYIVRIILNKKLWSL